ncbi:TPA: hypothetical protein ACGPAL_000144 [Streptococcus suis]
MQSIGEIKKGILKLADDFQEIIPLNRDINQSYNQLLGDLSWLGEGSSSDEIKKVMDGISRANVELEQQKQNMLTAVMRMQSIANRL